MNVKKVLATGIAATLLASLGAVALATSASAVDFGDPLEGDILWFNTTSTGLLDPGLTAANQVDGSEQPDATARPWQTLAVTGQCPAGTQSIQPYVHIPAPGNPVDWDAVPIAAPATTKDAQGRFYVSGAALADRMNKPQIRTYATAQGGTATLPYIVTCLDSINAFIGYFETPLTVSITATTPTTAMTYSIPKASLPTRDGGWEGGSGGGDEAAATTTALKAEPSGTDVLLTATLSPSEATGQVTFSEGSTTLATVPVSGGTAQHTVTGPEQGDHTYTASFVPADSEAYLPSSDTKTYTLGLSSGSLTVTLTVPEAPAVPDGTLTLEVPNTPVPLAGSRDAGNTRVTASGSLAGITVTDTRRDGLVAGWRVSVQASDFTGAGDPIGAKYLGWAPGTPSIEKEVGAPLSVQAGAAVQSFFENTASTGLGSSKTLAQTTASGRGTTTLDAQLNLAIPPSTTEGSYTSTITVTLVSE